MATLLENALVVTLEKERPVLEQQKIVVQDNLVAALGKNVREKAFKIDETIDCSGKIVLPGLVNAHSHLTETLQKSFRDNARMEVWREYRAQTEEIARLEPEEIEAAAQLACAELLRSGVTTVVDHFSTRPGLSVAKMEAILRAFEKTGIRGILAPSLRDQEPLRLLKVNSGKKRAFPERKKETWRDELFTILENAGSYKLGTVMLGPSSPQNCSDSLLRDVIKIAEKHNLGIHTHLLETRLGRWLSNKLYKEGLVQHLWNLGFLSPRLSTAHSIWIDDKDMELMAKAEVSVVHCPASNLKLGSGIASISRLRRHGINVALGTDGGDTSDSYSIFDQIRLAAFLSRVKEEDSDNWITAADALRMATIGGASALPSWRGKIGKIAIGYRADLVILKPHIRLRPLNDVVHQLVFCEGGHSVDTVFVDGEIIIRNGSSLRFNEEKLIQRAEEISKRMYRIYSRIKGRITNESRIKNLYQKIGRGQNKDLFKIANIRQ